MKQNLQCIRFDKRCTITTTPLNHHMNISFKTVSMAAIPSVIVFAIFDCAVEQVVAKITGTTFLQLFKKTEAATYGQCISLCYSIHW